jgi:O-acetylserine/cysteine efflux transporter
VLLGVILLQERPGAMNWLAVGIAASGMLLIGSQRMILGEWTGFALVTLGALSWGVANILLKRLPKTNMLHLMIWMSLIPPLPLLAFSVFIEGWPAIRSALRDIDWPGFGAVLYTGLLSTVVAYAIWGRMMQRYSTATVAPFALLTPVFGLSLAYGLLGEQHSVPEALASLLVVSALAINFWAVPLQLQLAKLLSKLRSATSGS